MEATKAIMLLPERENAEVVEYSTICTKSLCSSVDEEQVDNAK
jgi:hypothetical protein